MANIISPNEVIVTNDDESKYYRVKQTRRFIYIEWGWLEGRRKIIKEQRTVDYRNAESAKQHFDDLIIKKLNKGYK
jgi:predicted DNA-binding WGR domain protein